MSPRKPHPAPTPTPVPEPTPLPPVPVSGRRWGVISGDDTQVTPASCAYLRSKGVTVLTIHAIWQFLQPAQGYDVTQSGDWPAFVARLSAAKSAGLRVSLRLALHYPPSWATTIVPKLRQADGSQWSGLHGSGDEVRDWIWSGIGQNAVADFVTRVLRGIAAAGLTDTLDSVSAGSGPYGEMHFPRPGRWDSPQTISALHPMRPTAEPALGNWYLDSQSRFIVWLIGVIRQSYAGPILVLHPSFGLRSDWTPSSPPYLVEFNAGADPRRYIQAYKGLPGATPYATWLEDTDRVGYPGPDSSKASWRKVLDEATAAGLPCWGENASAGIGAAGMDALFAGPVKAGVAGVNFLESGSWAPLADRFAGLVAAA